MSREASAGQIRDHIVVHERSLLPLGCHHSEGEIVAVVGRIWVCSTIRKTLPLLFESTENTQPQVSIASAKAFARRHSCLPSQGKTLLSLTATKATQVVLPLKEGAVDPQWSLLRLC